ncbi:hypothetical protein BDF20DRAFT_916543 [Mycotypha africana]|uniref:uncharacterized protein n=1 Tax=Mycotypha africana TaxID=64632 RepID=UPI00230071EE|nr:uncharacterized protein BDF20DRAFT_916543 [Mycotypha africana]KAI8969164.1 hypothetical protein BDF20DRAFT_916543 [Mycotypha africana]
MDFPWVSDIPNTRKQASRIPNPDIDDNSTMDNFKNSLFQSEIPKTLSRSGSRLSYTPPSNNNNTKISEIAKRSRAGTMPSSSIPPLMSLGHSHLYMSATAQDRPNQSPSLTSSSATTTLHQPANLYSHSNLSSPLDENATDSIASTLASLGLHEDSRIFQRANSSNNSNNNVSSTDTTTDNSAPSSYLESMTRNRAFTVSSRSTLTDMTRPHESLAFSPFPEPNQHHQLAIPQLSSQQQQQQQHQQQQQQQQQNSKSANRPRAISLGMMDSPLTTPQLQPLQQLSHGSTAFSPFDIVSDFQNSGSTNSKLTDENSNLSNLNTNSSNNTFNTSNNLNNTSLPLLYQPCTFSTTNTLNSQSDLDNVTATSDFRHDLVENSHLPSTNHYRHQSSTDTTAASSSSVISSSAQIPSRALWLGNINPSLSVPDLHKMFSRYGRVESARILSDKECAFVNFDSIDSAVAAREDLVNRLGCKVGGTVVKVGFGKADVDLAMALTQDAGPNAQGPTRSLWVGNIPSNISPAVLRSVFQVFGSIESIRILSHKNCGFVNFERQEDAVRARKQMQNKEILGTGTGTVRIGFARAPTNNPGEVIEDVVISGKTVTSYATPNNKQNHSSSNYKTAESMNDNDSAVAFTRNAADKSRLDALNLPSSSSVSQSSFNSSDENAGNTSDLTSTELQKALTHDNSHGNNKNTNTSQWATVILMASMMMNAQKQQQQKQENGKCTVIDAFSKTVDGDTPARLAAERKMIMQQLGYEPKADEVDRVVIEYMSTIPTAPEFGTDRSLSPARLREIRKLIDNGQGMNDIESIAKECYEEIVELCSDYIGNTVVQKLFENCCEETKFTMLKKIAPYLASIGVHKNGTWAAQKIITTACTDEQIAMICEHIAPFVPLLLLDQFGNYVVQCCLRMGPTRNQYIFDGIVDKCWEIGQGRYGARAVRAILENAIVTKEQQIYVAAAIMQNALLLTTNANGSILVNWLLDTSGLLGQYRALCNLS